MVTWEDTWRPKFKSIITRTPSLMANDQRQCTTLDCELEHASLKKDILSLGGFDHHHLGSMNSSWNPAYSSRSGHWVYKVYIFELVWMRLKAYSGPGSGDGVQCASIQLHKYEHPVQTWLWTSHAHVHIWTSLICTQIHLVKNILCTNCRFDPNQASASTVGKCWRWKFSSHMIIRTIHSNVPIWGDWWNLSLKDH